MDTRMAVRGAARGIAEADCKRAARGSVRSAGNGGLPSPVSPGDGCRAAAPPSGLRLVTRCHRPADHASFVAQVSAADSMSWVTSAGWETIAT
jgi:hypothetical protein